MMIALIKLIVGIYATLLVNPINTYPSLKENNELTQVYIADYSIKDSQVNAFQILENKCNVCHHKRNKRRVFTLENMNLWANDIYKQVFVKKRMPKGKKNKLNPTEYQTLLTWISSTKTSNNGI